MSEVSAAGEIAVTTATPQTEAEKQDKSPAAIPVDDSNKKIVIRSPVPSSASAASGTKPAVAIVKLTPPIAQAPSVPLMPPSTECVQRSDGLKMSALLPLQKCYSCRRSAVDAAKLAVVQTSGKGVKVDDARSGSKKVVLRCPSVMKQVPGSTAKWLGDLMDDFKCEKREGESIWCFRRRRANELEMFVHKKGMCNFKLECRKKKHKDGNRTSYWKFVLQENGLNFIDHEPGCKSTAKLTGRLLRSLIRSSVHSDPRQKNRSLMSKLKSAGVTEAMLPSKSSTYRAQKALRMEIDAWYDDPDSKARPGRPKIKRTREDTNAAKTTNANPEASSLVPMPKAYGDRQVNAVDIPTKNFDIFAKSYDRPSASNASSASHPLPQAGPSTIEGRADPSTMDGAEGESTVAPKPKRSKIDIGDSTSSNGASDSFTIAV